MIIFSDDFKTMEELCLDLKRKENEKRSYRF